MYILSIRQFSLEVLVAAQPKRFFWLVVSVTYKRNPQP